MKENSFPPLIVRLSFGVDRQMVCSILGSLLFVSISPHTFLSHSLSPWQALLLAENCRAQRCRKREDAETDELDELVAEELDLEIDVIVIYIIDFGGDQSRASELFNYIRVNFLLLQCTES
jgi:hypothetical protein